MKLTLQNRITTLTILSSVIFISVFTFIQLNNQVNNITRFNSYQANLSALILKNNLEVILKNTSSAEPSAYLQSSLLKLKESRIIMDALVFNEDGLVIAATQSELIGKSISYKDLNKWQDLEYLEKESKWFVAETTLKPAHQLNLYFALKSDPQVPFAYAAKLTFTLGNIQSALGEVYWPVIFSIIIIILLNILLGYVLSKIVIDPVKVLNTVTKTIADGDLSIRISIKTNDELQELGETFNYMTEELIKMKERAENANPLTKLPGNIVIQEEVEKRISTNQKFVVVYCDLDNFKAFNDKYGIAKGDEAIKLTAEILKDSLQKFGAPNDFIGHEGGDDFILLTTPEKTKAVTEFIIQEFDKSIGDFYTQEDLKQGYIIAHARDGSIKHFPLMSISLAGVTNETRRISTYAEVTNIAAELKKKAKAVQKSVFVIDERQE